ncbi:MAG TPA: spherulation-specific family 4 protein [Micromonosporaceae bacterium]|jgi:hypothetical protein|nr:spherulation-specific family 4 protein [Micromonosporaceae bacterium]
MDWLVPLYVHPSTDPGAWQPGAWRAVAGAGGVTVVVNVSDGPGRGPDPAYRAATEVLARAGVPMLGYVDLGYAGRPLSDLLDDVAHWADYPVRGVFLDQAPASPFSVGPAALAVRAARRLGLPEVVLNPGTVPDRLYRDFGAKLCVFEGGWADYQAWSGAGGQPGDGHLVYAVPPADLPYARRLLADRGAGFGLATDLAPPAPYGGLPSALPMAAGQSGSAPPPWAEQKATGTWTGAR